MDLSCIISSGDLELYVLGMLPEEEAYKIEQLAVLFPEIRAELDQISESLEGLAATTSVAPSAKVKDNLMDKLRQLKNEEQTSVPLVSIPPIESDVNDNRSGEVPVVPLRNTGNKRSFLLAASWLGLIVSLGALLYFISVNNKNGRELAVLRHRVDTLNNHLTLQQQQLQASSQMLQMFQSSEYIKINLTPLQNSLETIAQVFWNRNTHEVYVSDMALPQPPANKQYQLWAIVDGKPVDAGMISLGNQPLQKMKAFDRAEAFAISIEKEGGSPVPTEVFSMGKI